MIELIDELRLFIDKMTTPQIVCAIIIFAMVLVVLGSDNK